MNICIEQEGRRRVKSWLTGTVTNETGFRFFSFTPFQRMDFYTFNRLHGALSHALKYQAGRLMQQRGIIMTVSQKLPWQEKADSTDDRLPESVKS